LRPCGGRNERQRRRRSRADKASCHSYMITTP
jgi:hypothetical protein